MNASVSAVVVHAYDGETGAPWANLVGLQWSTTTGWPSVVPWPADA